MHWTSWFLTILILKLSKFWSSFFLKTQTQLKKLILIEISCNRHWEAQIRFMILSLIFRQYRQNRPNLKLMDKKIRRESSTRYRYLIMVLRGIYFIRIEMLMNQARLPSCQRRHLWVYKRCKKDLWQACKAERSNSRELFLLMLFHIMKLWQSRQV